MILTDTHTHIYYHEGEALQQQIQRCLDNEVMRLFLPNVDSESIPKVLGAAAQYPENCFPMLGLHPCDVKENFRQELDIIHRSLQENKVYAIGEIGLDLYWDKSTLDWQKEAFRIQVQWAKERSLPIVIHCREAFDQQFALLEELHDEKLFGIFHCFTGSKEQAQHAIELGFYLGIGGVVTYKNSGLAEVVKELDLRHIVLETDAPYLAPVPKRGKPNESSYIPFIAQKVAELKEISLEEVAEITTENSKTIFKI
ncbi:TatD family hydrolase [Olivibacter sitiensis]|uniref:TatD family hydrolase n=1 Tax=Olivibacter sitiensis TaxID=376470 RepID=UPI0004106692|nr:TatD family hydrolase [Olivibacter sitiensis]